MTKIAILFAAVGFTVFVGIVLLQAVQAEKQRTRDLAIATARAVFDKDLAFRQWATSHGGVYVPADERTPPNRYLEHVPERDLTTPSGRKLTLMNPAYMLAQLMREYPGRYGVQGRITSLEYLNPDNAPDAWEREALEAFAGGKKEVMAFITHEGEPQLRYMQRMVTRKGCLKCHEAQGYRVGDIRGGVGVRVPLAPYLAVEAVALENLYLSHGIFWCIGMVLLAAYYGIAHRRGVERERAEEALQKYHDHLEELVEERTAKLEQNERRLKESQVLARMGQWELNLVNNTLQWADEVYRIFEIDREQFGASYEAFLEAVHPQDRAAVDKAYTDSLADKTPYMIDHRLLMKDGRVKFVREQCRTEYNELGEPLCAIGIVQDLTDLKEMELALRHAKEHAEAANRAKSIFLANMSHELRTPLNAILGFSEMLGRDPAATAEQQEKLSVINRSGEHLLAMINDVLDLSKIEAGAMELEPTAFDLSRLLEDVGRMFEVRAESASLSFILDADPAMARYVEADNGKLRQILINLLGNAVKFTREGGVTLRARTLPVTDDPTRASLQLEVEDTGPGIPPEEQQHIFDPFVQAGHSKSNIKGTGLGLAISNAFIQLMGGSIRVESEPGKGALFHVELPVLLAEGTEAGGAESAAPTVTGLQPDQPAWRILIVEDNLENRLLLKGYLEPVGFAVREAENGKVAMAEFEQWRPHFIWMDMRMPVMDGFEATRRIRALPGGDAVKIVALTASVFKEQHQRILQEGCDDVLHKPFRAGDLFATMERYLGVRYRYAEESMEVPAQPAVHLTGAMLKRLPAEQLDALGEASIRLDIQAATAVIGRLQDVDAEIAEGLQILMKEYQFEQILKLLERD